MLKKGDAQARLSLHLSKCHIVGNHMSRLILIKLTSVIVSLKSRTTIGQTAKRHSDGVSQADR